MATNEEKSQGLIKRDTRSYEPQAMKEKKHEWSSSDQKDQEKNYIIGWRKTKKNKGKNYIIIIRLLW